MEILHQSLALSYQHHALFSVSISYLIHNKALVVTHTGQGHPEVIRVTLVVISLHLVELQEALTSQLMVLQLHIIWREDLNDSEQDCGNSSVLAMELLQSWTKLTFTVSSNQWQELTKMALNTTG